MLEMMSSLLQAGGLTPGNSLENISNLFKTLDLNGDGHISEDEFIKAFLDNEHSVYFRILFIFVFFLKILIFWTQSQNKDQKQEKLSVKKGKQRRKNKENAFHNLLIKLVSFGLVGNKSQIGFFIEIKL